eukprot:1161345-Pelagomonas_calceolata.AAC.21
MASHLPFLHSNKVQIPPHHLNHSPYKPARPSAAKKAAVLPSLLHSKKGQTAPKKSAWTA